MSIKNEDDLTLDQVLKICQNVKDENIEVIANPIIRPKTHEFIQKYDFDINDVRQIIRNLSKNDYNKGPVTDDNPNYRHSFWIFIKFVSEIKVKVYIKIKIINHRRKIIVFSIHEEGVYEL